MATVWRIVIDVDKSTALTITQDNSNALTISQLLIDQAICFSMKRVDTEAEKAPLPVSMKRVVKIYTNGGVIQEVIAPGDVRVEVYDTDIEDYTGDEKNIVTTVYGDEAILTVWTLGEG
jgi:hypothetical protein